MSLWDMSLIRPNWLWAFIPIIAFGWVLIRRRRSLGSWETAAKPELLRAMRAFGHVETGQRDLSGVWPIIAAGLTVVALSGPAIERRDALSYRNLDAVIFVMDLSASVTESPNWSELQTFVRFGIASLGTRPAALIVFSGDAYVASDLTLDHKHLGQTVFLLDAGLIPDPGTRPERGLALAAQMVRQGKVITGDVVLITDGDWSFDRVLQASENLKQANLRLSVVSTTKPLPRLTSLTKLNGGQVFGVADVDAFATWLQEDARSRLERQDYPLMFQNDLGRYVLALALMPLFFSFRRTSS